MAPTSPPVVVAVDGSKHGRHAAVWASAEAKALGTSLQLVHVIDVEAERVDAALRHARRALDEARTAVADSGSLVEMETEILHGDPAAALIEASRTCALMCLGAKGMRDSASRHRGAISAMVAESAFCPVVVVRGGGHQPGDDQWVVAVLDESPISHGVLHVALDEGQRRRAPVLALTSWSARESGVPGTDAGRHLHERLDRYLRATQDDDTDVRVYSLALPLNLTEMLATVRDLAQLVIVGMDDVELVVDLIGPEARSLLRHTNVSVMVFRDQRRWSGGDDGEAHLTLAESAPTHGATLPPS